MAHNTMRLTRDNDVDREPRAFITDLRLSPAQRKKVRSLRCCCHDIILLPQNTLEGAVPVEGIHIPGADL
eukprot:1291620-Pyramimonas_sp.AAC.5